MGASLPKLSGEAVDHAGELLSILILGNRVAEFTDKQGQYLAYIYHYTKVNRRPPAESDIQRFFQVTPPTAHSMVLRLEQAGLISRLPRVPRSIQVLVPFEDLPPLD